MSAACPGSIVAHPALSLDLQACSMHGGIELRQDHGCEPVRVAVATLRLGSESLGEDRSQRVKRPKVEPSQRQPCGVKGIVGNGQRIDSIRAGWHGHPRVVGDGVHRTHEGKQGGSAVAQNTVFLTSSRRKRCACVRKDFQKLFSNVKYCDLRASGRRLEIRCPERGCGFESHALRSRKSREKTQKSPGKTGLFSCAEGRGRYRCFSRYFDADIVGLLRMRAQAGI